MEGSNKLIDVLGVPPDSNISVAFEVTLSFSNIRENIISDLRAGVSEVVIVCRTRKGLDNAEDIIATSGFPEHMSHRIRCEMIDAFFS
jgi:hypothetical protein